MARHLENGGHLGLEVNINFVPKMFHHVSTSCLILICSDFPQRNSTPPNLMVLPQ